MLIMHILYKYDIYKYNTASAVCQVLFSCSVQKNEHESLYIHTHLKEIDFKEGFSDFWQFCLPACAYL